MFNYNLNILFLKDKYLSTVKLKYIYFRNKTFKL